MAGLIEDYALLGDLQTAALVGRDGSIDWLCFPHFDSPACFAALLGTEDNGHWRLAPAAGGTATRRGYRGDTLVLETVWETAGGQRPGGRLHAAAGRGAGRGPGGRGHLRPGADAQRAAAALRLRPGGAVGAPGRPPGGRGGRAGLGLAEHAGPAGGAGPGHALRVHRLRRPAGAVRAHLAPVLAAAAEAGRRRSRRWTTRRRTGPSGCPTARTTGAGRARSAARWWCSRR